MDGRAGNRGAMMRRHGRHPDHAGTMKTTILTDIEGTTSSISFVRDVLFP